MSGIIFLKKNLNLDTISMKKLKIFLVICSMASVSCQMEDEILLDCAQFEWEYNGSGDPSKWSGCFMECAGHEQSPVNIVKVTKSPTLKALKHNYEAVPFELFNNGHTIEFEYEEGSELIFQGLPYELLQFHFHTGSEHKVLNKQYPMEVHLVHKNISTGNLAVVGIFVEEGAENEFLNKLGTVLPLDSERFSKSALIDVTELLPTKGSYFNYAGSLTTPPCSQIVNWLVMKNPVSASSAQIKRFSDILQNNFRPIQPTNDRVIKLYEG